MENGMLATFYIRAIRLGERNKAPLVVDWVPARSDTIPEVKREARLISETAHSPEWIWPMAEAIQVIDKCGVERYRCWCRVEFSRRTGSRAA
jgi:hypothetical protein